MPEIEQRLIAKGLSAAEATAVLNAVLDGQLRGPQEDLDRDGNVWRLHFIASIVAACICMGLAYASGGGFSAVKTFLSLMLPLSCIWFVGSIYRWVAYHAVLIVRIG